VGIDIANFFSSDGHWPFHHQNLVSCVSIGSHTTSNHGQSLHNGRDRCQLRDSNVPFAGSNLYVHFLIRSHA
jgi:hypothetical protein